MVVSAWASQCCAGTTRQGWHSMVPHQRAHAGCQHSVIAHPTALPEHSSFGVTVPARTLRGGHRGPPIAGSHRAELFARVPMATWELMGLSHSHAGRMTQPSTAACQPKLPPTYVPGH